MLEARILLGAALGVVAVAHFLPMWGSEHPWLPLYRVWRDVARAGAGLADGRWSLDRLIGSVSIVCVAATLVAAPFLTGFLHRAVALLWVMRGLAVAFSGWFCFMIYEAVMALWAYTGSSPSHWTLRVQKFSDELGPGMWLLMLSFWLATVGFMRIPAARPLMEHERR